MSYLWLYVTHPSKEDAVRVARALVHEKWIACANLYENVSSVYEWQGEVQEDQEVIMVGKTRSDLFDGVEARVKELHPDDCPCVIGLPIEKGSTDFLNWIGETTRAADETTWTV